MLKRISLLILASIMLVCALSCEKEYASQSDGTEISDKGTHSRSNLFGFIVQADGKNGTYEAMQAFLTACADIGVNAKLYTFASQDDLVSQTDSAKKDNCDCVLFYSKDFDCAQSAKELEECKTRTAGLLSDENGFSYTVNLSDCTRDIAERLLSEHTSSALLIYSSAEYDTLTLESELKADGVNVNVMSHLRTEYAYKDAKNSLSAYLKENPDIGAIYAIGEQNARPAVLAAKEIGNIKVIGCELTDINKELFSDGLYALCVTPYSDMTAKAVYAMRKLQDGESVKSELCPIHIVTRDKLERYTAISDKAKKAFMG